MKAVHCTGYGPPEVLQLVEIPTPEPTRGQVRIRMRATAVTSQVFPRTVPAQVTEIRISERAPQ